MSERFPYTVNNDFNRPIVGLPFTCGCGRLNTDLKPTEHWLSAGDKLYCDRCLPGGRPTRCPECCASLAAAPLELDCACGWRKKPLRNDEETQPGG